MVAAIYETVIRPALYGAFMDAWEQHIQARLGDPESSDGMPVGPDDLPIDPELQAHFSRAYDILEQIGRKAPQKGGQGNLSIFEIPCPSIRVVDVG